MLDLLIKNGTYVNPEGSFQADIAVQDEKITLIDRNIPSAAWQEIDASGKLIFPGVIDTHVHLPWPSVRYDSVDNFHTGTMGAIFGGVTTIIEYVVPDESGRILPALEKQADEARRSAHCDYSFHLILRKITSQTLDEMAQAVEMGIPSFKVYTAYQGFRLEDGDVLTVLQRANEINALVCFHAEDGVLVNQASRQLVERACTKIEYYPEAHPRSADIEATQRVITYARETGTRIHIVHVNTREGARAIQNARSFGQPISGETCPQYLSFTQDVYKNRSPEAAYYILAPVIRESRDQDALWEAIASDGLQTIATDHCPYSIDQKTEGGDDFRVVPGGAGGIETSLPILYTQGVKSGKISINRMVEIMATNPAKIFNLYPKKGIINVGSDADLVIYDPDASPTPIRANLLHSAMDHTIFEGCNVIGRVETTILRGTILMDKGTLVETQPKGQFLKRKTYE